MSLYILENSVEGFEEVRVGWDANLSTYFAQMWRVHTRTQTLALPGVELKPDVWVGLAHAEIKDVGTLRTRVAPARIPRRVLRELEEDRRPGYLSSARLEVMVRGVIAVAIAPFVCSAWEDVVGTILAVCVLLAPLLWLRRGTRFVRRPGCSANSEEVIAADLPKVKEGRARGVVLARLGDKRLVRALGGNVLFWGSEGPVGAICATLLTQLGSAVVYDRNRLLFEATAPRREALGSRVFRFEPASRDSVRINPLTEIAKSADRDELVMEFVAALLDEPQPLNRRTDYEGDDIGPAVPYSFWKEDGYPHALLTWACAYLLDHGEDSERNIPGMLKLLRMPFSMRRELLCGDSYSRSVQLFAYRVLEKEVKLTRAGYDLNTQIAVILERLGVYEEPVIAGNVSESTVALSEIVDSDKKVTLYICSSPDDEILVRPIARLIVTLVCAMKNRLADGYIWRDTALGADLDSDDKLMPKEAPKQLELPLGCAMARSVARPQGAQEPWPAPVVHGPIIQKRFARAESEKRFARRRRRWLFSEQKRGEDLLLVIEEIRRIMPVEEVDFDKVAGVQIVATTRDLPPGKDVRWKDREGPGWRLYDQFPIRVIYPTSRTPAETQRLSAAVPALTPEEVMSIPPGEVLIEDYMGLVGLRDPRKPILYDIMGETREVRLQESEALTPHTLAALYTGWRLA